MTELLYPLVCFDLDGTLVDDTVYIWKTLHEAFNTDRAERQKACKDYFSGTITYKEWFENDLSLLKAARADKDKVDELLDNLTAMNGAFKTLNTLKKRGHIVAIISGSLDIVVKKLFPWFEFDHILINSISFGKDGQISGGTHTRYDVEAKADGLLELCRVEGVEPAQAVFVGDNENDVWIARKAGLPIAFNCKSRELAKVCKVEIKQKDLTEILRYIL